MKNADIHKGLEQAHRRDYQAKKLGTYVYPSELIIRQMEKLQEQMRDLQDQLKAAIRRESATEFMEQEGWQEWDISSDIEDFSRDTYFPFVGTKEELLRVFPNAACYSSGG